MLKPYIYIYIYIYDKGLPNIKILNSILSATFRKYKIKVSEMKSVSTICEELIWNIYVSDDRKEEYKSKLASTNIKDNEEESYIQVRAESEYRRKLNKK